GSVRGPVPAGQAVLARLPWKVVQCPASPPNRPLHIPEREDAPPRTRSPKGPNQGKAAFVSQRQDPADSTRAGRRTTSAAAPSTETDRSGLPRARRRGKS